MEKQLEETHHYIETAQERCNANFKPRKGQNDIVIHCVSCMTPSARIQAVCSYQSKVSPTKRTGDPAELLATSAVNFTTLRILSYAADELGLEL